MKINCPKCGAGLDKIAMSATVCCCSVVYDDETDEFTAEAVGENVEEVECWCSVCEHEWDWDAYRRNVKEDNHE